MVVRAGDMSMAHALTAFLELEDLDRVQTWALPLHAEACSADTKVKKRLERISNGGQVSPRVTLSIKKV